jgi:hypothetical protein
MKQETRDFLMLFLGTALAVFLLMVWMRNPHFRPVGRVIDKVCQWRGYDYGNLRGCWNYPDEIYFDLGPMDLGI